MECRLITHTKNDFNGGGRQGGRNEERRGDRAEGSLSVSRVLRVMAAINRLKYRNKNSRAAIMRVDRARIRAPGKNIASLCQCQHPGPLAPYLSLHLHEKLRPTPRYSHRSLASD